MRPRNCGLLLILTVCGLACTERERIVYEYPTDPVEVMLLNVSLVTDAATAFAAANSGITAADVDVDTNSEGLTLLDYLPDGLRLLNPYTGLRSEPQNRLAENTGEVGYVAESPNGTRCVFVVNAYHASLGEIAHFDNVDVLEQITIANAVEVTRAVEAWSGLQDGYATYPAVVANFRDLLPDSEWLQNPFALTTSEPGDGMAGLLGQVGYTPVTDSYGWNVGYLITAFGHHSEIFRRFEPYHDDENRRLRGNCNTVLYVIRQYATHNEGRYPRDLASDQALDGRTVLEMLANWNLRNPWTDLPMQPHDGTVVSPGDIGYFPIYEGEVPTDCLIVGQLPGAEILTLPIR